MAAKDWEGLQAQIIARAEQDEGFRAKLRADSRAAILGEFGVSVPKNVDVRVHEDGGNIVLRFQPEVRLTEDELGLIAAGQGDYHVDDPYDGHPDR